jgi:RNA polymerase sigma factor (sigma-70 family)
MRRDDFTNWTPEKCKRKIHEWQETEDKELFNLLLAKYDKYLIKLSWDFHKRVKEEGLEDIYHSAILGFGNALRQFKAQAPSLMILAVIKAYVRRELEHRFTRKRLKEFKDYHVPISGHVPVDYKEVIDVNLVLSSSFLSDKERQLIKLRFNDNMSIEDIGKSFGLCRQSVSTQLDKTLAKIRKRLEEDGR